MKDFKTIKFGEHLFGVFNKFGHNCGWIENVEGKWGVYHAKVGDSSVVNCLVTKDTLDEAKKYISEHNEFLDPLAMVS